MSSTINSDDGIVSGSAGIKTTADSSGLLALQSNGVTGLTLSTSLAIGIGSSPSYGTTGQLLTSSGTGSAPTWTTVTGGAQGFVTQYQGVSAPPTMNSFSIALI